ncbi:MAG: OmpA family protein [Myxococcales bacterium]|nr:OmpA family protein [Myxococcales bacterium]
MALPALALLTAVAAFMAAGCESAPPDDPTTTQLGKCSCVCRVDSSGMSAAWGATFVPSPESKACIDVCGAYESRLENRSCRPVFTGRFEASDTKTSFSNDSDYDGVPDSQDRCPNQAGPSQNGGCPVTGTPVIVADGDRDGDGVMDSADKCPDKAETKNGYEDDDGCPDEIPADVASFSGSIEGVVFKTGSPALDAKSFPVLEKAAEVFKKHPELRVEIGGHTDNVGNDKTNTTLSQKRAESVKAWFVGKGLAANRFEAKGYGPSKPVAENTTPEGRGKNRRVEFTLIKK